MCQHGNEVVIHWLQEHDGKMDELPKITTFLSHTPSSVFDSTVTSNLPNDVWATTAEVSSSLSIVEATCWYKDNGKPNSNSHLGLDFCNSLQLS